MEKWDSCFPIWDLDLGWDLSLLLQHREQIYSVVERPLDGSSRSAELTHPRQGAAVAQRDVLRNNTGNNIFGLSLSCLILCITVFDDLFQVLSLNE